MYNQIEDILLNISIVIATVWIVKRFWGSFFEEKQNSILSVSLWIVYSNFSLVIIMGACKFLQPF